jgi:hypothetical protein
VFPRPDPDGTDHRADEDPPIAMPAGLVAVHYCLDNPVNSFIARDDYEHPFWQKT